LGVGWAFLVRDFRITMSYKTGFALNVLSSLVGVLGVFFLSRTFAGAAGAGLERYGGDYFGFVVLGVAVTNFMAIGLGGVASKVREAQVTGTLEIMLVSPNRLAVLLLGPTIWNHVFAAFTLGLYLVAGVLLGMDVTVANLPVALAAFVLGVVGFNGLGLIAASAVILVKQGDPVTWVVSGASALLAGVFYPVSVLPQLLQVAAQALPLTHTLEIVRRAVLAGEGLSALLPNFLGLAILTVVLAVLGLAATAVAVRIAQRDGSLSYY
jgi:ABC-2 type transport system permease protein